jgi:hypothetical protein
LPLNLPLIFILQMNPHMRSSIFSSMTGRYAVTVSVCGLRPQVVYDRYAVLCEQRDGDGPGPGGHMGEVSRPAAVGVRAVKAQQANKHPRVNRHPHDQRTVNPACALICGDTRDPPCAAAERWCRCAPLRRYGSASPVPPSRPGPSRPAQAVPAQAEARSPLRLARDGSWR